MGGPRLPLERKAQILDLFASGTMPLTIAEIEKVPVATVYRVLREQGLATGHKGRPGLLDRFTGEQIEQLVDDYNDPMIKVHQVCEQYGISYNQLYNLLSVLQIPPRDRGKTAVLSRKARADHGVGMYLEGKPLNEILSETGFGWSQFYRILYERGIELRRNKKG
jgi:transposase